MDVTLHTGLDRPLELILATSSGRVSLGERYWCNYIIEGVSGDSLIGHNGLVSL